MTLYQLQEDYRSPAFYQAVFALAKNQANQIRERTGAPMELETIAHDATTRLIEQYLKRPGYRIEKYFNSRVFREVQYALWSPYKVRRDKSRADLHDDHHVETVETADPLDILTNLELYHLHTSQTYGNAIHAIAQSVGSKAKVRCKALQLRRAWCILHP